MADQHGFKTGDQVVLVRPGYRPRFGWVLPPLGHGKRGRWQYDVPAVWVRLRGQARDAFVRVDMLTKVAEKP